MTSPLEPQVIVVGAGYAGVLAANRLARKTRQKVLLIHESPALVHRVRLHETAARGRSSLVPLAGLLHPGVRSLHGAAVGLDAGASELTVHDAEGRHVLRYRCLVLALGSHLHPAIETDAPHALALASHERALAYYGALTDAPDGAWVTVVGGGLTAIELASEVAEAHPRLCVRLVCDALAPDLPEGARAELLRVFRRLGVQVVEGARVESITASHVHTADGSFASHLTALAAGFRASVPAWLSSLPRSEDGRLVVDHALRVVGHPSIYAVGDVAAPPARCIGHGQKTTRMGCVNAMPLAAHAADVIAGHDAEAFHFNYPGRNISLGRRAGIVLFTDADDRPTGRFLSGRLAALIKALVCRFVLTSLRLEARERMGYRWLGRGSLRRSPALPVLR